MGTQRELTVDDYINILRRRWMVIATFVVLGSAAGIGATHVLPKRYTSETLVLIEQPNISPELVPQVISNTSERLASMQQQILSRSRLEPIINQFHLYNEEVNKQPVEAVVARLRKAIDVSPVAPMA